MLEMKRKTLYICHKDKEYAGAMCARLSLMISGMDLAAVCNADALCGEEIYEMKNYMSAPAAALDIAEKYSQDCALKHAGECRLIGFTSAAGGCGTTAAAVSLGRSLSEVGGLKTLYISFDALSEKYSPAQEGAMAFIYSLAYGKEVGLPRFICGEHGLWSLGTEGIINPCSFLDAHGASSMLQKLSCMFDRIIADIPLDYGAAFELFDMCDDFVVCLGWQPERMALGQSLADHLLSIGINAIGFAPEYDEAGTDDIYSHFGAEVRELAKKLSCS